MSKSVRSLIIAALLMPGLGFAAGLHFTGNVYVTPNVSLSGSMNVRWNTAAAGSPYIYATAYAGGTVGFFGRDSEGETFACWVSPGTALYDAAVDIKNNLKDGSQIYVTKSATTTDCTNIHLGNYSYSQS